MDKKGQTLLLFVLLIPIFVILTALIVDIGSMGFTYQKIKGIVDESIKEYYVDNEISAAEEILGLNDIPLEDVQINTTTDSIEISLEYQMDAIFGKIIGFDTYDIKVHRVGTKEEDKVIINEKE